MAKQLAGPKTDDIGQTFRVVRGQVGAWNAKNDDGKPDVFTEREFRRLHPIPDSEQARDQIDPDTYHASLLDRLLKLGVIVHAPGETPTPTPLGPLGTPGRPVKNAAIEASINEAIRAREQSTALNRANLSQTGTRVESKASEHSGTVALAK